MDDTDLELLDPEAESRLHTIMTAQQQRREADSRARRARRELWTAHHWPEKYERCVRLGQRHVCRRCLALYPVALAVMTLSLAGGELWPSSLDLWVIWLACVPATVEYVADALGLVRYHPRRQLVVTLVVALALGRGLSYEMTSRWSWEFWGPLLVFGTVWFAAAAAGQLRTERTPSRNAQ